MSRRGLPKSIEWIGGLDGHVRMIDQTLLPAELAFIDCRDEKTMWDAIKRLCVRGAPAIGIAAAMGAVLGARDYDGSGRNAFLAHLANVCDDLATARPTAVNLCWALDRMRACAAAQPRADIADLKLALLKEAKRIRDEDTAMCRSIGVHGLELIRPECGILTHCNAGALATAELGTALAPMYLAHERGVAFRVYAGETRPLLQGARLTVWELMQAGIDVTLLCDGMVGALMGEGLVDLVITGADRIAANGDVANKIGTYSVAVLARHHRIPFYVAAPSSTFDLSMSDGTGIPIEQRDPDEVRSVFGTATSPSGVPCFTPAFDVTPVDLVSGIITEKGLIQPVSSENIAEALSTG